MMIDGLKNHLIQNTEYAEKYRTVQIEICANND